MTQRNLLENSLDLLKTLRGPAKILRAPSAVGMPTLIENVINPSNGAPGAGWVPFGLTRGGINVVKTLDIAVRDDVDQILGAYDQDVTDRAYSIVTQMAEVLNDQTQLSVAMALDTSATTMASTSAVQQTMRFLDDGTNKTPESMWAIIFPKATAGKLFAFVFRRGAVSGGDKTFRFDKNDPASPPLEVRFFPVIATIIDTNDSYGRVFELL